MLPSVHKHAHKVNWELQIGQSVNVNGGKTNENVLSFHVTGNKQVTYPGKPYHPNPFAR